MAKISRKLQEMKEYQLTRSASDEGDFMLTITFNLLHNLANRNNFIHNLLNQYRTEQRKFDTNLTVATGFYVCSLITCWETFFRDLFVFVCNKDLSISQRLEAEVATEIPLNLSLGEFYAGKYNFQNLSHTRDAFDKIFNKQTEELSDYFTLDVFKGLMFLEYSMIFKWIAEGIFKEKVDDTLRIAFEMRHRVTHDANYMIEFNPLLLSEIECVFQMIPQFFLSSIAKQYAQKRLVYNRTENHIRVTVDPTKDELPYALSVKDFMANDWETVE